MPEPTFNEFLQSVGGTSPSVSTNPATAPAPASSQDAGPLLPATQEALAKAAQVAQANRLPKVEPVSRFDDNWAAKLGARSGVPFDTQTGVPFMTRLRMARQPTPAEEETALKAAYPNGNVRRNSYGWLVVTKPGPDGKPTDVLADPIGLDIGDAANVLASLHTMLGGAIGGAGGAKLVAQPGLWKSLVTIVGMATGGAVAGAAGDVIVRSDEGGPGGANEGQPIQPGEIAARRGIGAAKDAALGAAVGAGAKVFTTLVSPLTGSMGPLQFDSKAAQQYFKAKYGISLQQTPGEATGNSFLQHAEALEATKPGASMPFERLYKQREESLGELQRVALGGAVPDEEAAGQRALNAIGAQIAPIQQDVERSAFQTGQAASGELLAGTGTGVDKTAVGGVLRAGAERMRSSFQGQADALYDQVRSNPLVKFKNISGDPLATDATDLLAKLPSTEKVVAGPILGPNGVPVTLTKKEPLKEFVPDGILAKLNALRQGRGQQFRLDELMQMRREVDNSIAQGEAIPGVQTHYLQQIRNTLTGRIETGLNDLDPKLLTDWQKANDFYAANVGRFKRAGISQMFRDPEQLNYQEDTELAKRATTNPDTYAAYKDFFGPNSPEIGLVHQSIRDDVLGQTPLSSTIDSAGFVRRIDELAKNNPTALVDAYGADTAKQLRASANALRASQGGNLPANELQEAISSSNVSGQRLLDMQAAQSTKDMAYRNGLVRAIGEGNFKPDTIKPTELVDRMVFRSDTQPTDLRKVTDMLQTRPDVLEDLRRLTFKRVLDNATVFNAKTGNTMLNAMDLDAALKDPNLNKRLATVLGPSNYEDMAKLRDFLMPGSMTSNAYKAAGGLGAGQQIANLVERGPLRFLPQAIKNFVTSTIYTTPPLRAYLSNTLLGPESKSAIANTMIASTPFLEAAIKTYGEGKSARRIVGEIKSAIDDAVKGNPGDAHLPQREPTMEEFMQSIGGTNMQPTTAH